MMLAKCVPLCDVRSDIFEEPSLSARQKEIQKTIIEAPPAGFKDDQFAASSDVSIPDTLIVSTYFLVVMGTPLGLFVALCTLLVCGTWSSLAMLVGFAILLAVHPLPQMTHENNFHPLTVRLMVAMFRYFSYR